MKPVIHVNAYGVNCALGNSPKEVAGRLFAGDTQGIQLQIGWVQDKPLLVGAANVPLPALRAEWHLHASRNNRVLLHAMEQIEKPVRTAIEKLGNHRVGVVLGTSTTGIGESQKLLQSPSPGAATSAGYRYAMQEQGSPAEFLRAYWDLGGPAWVVSTACSSSARAFIAAKRLLEQNICDAVITGGVDTLCKLTLNGFSALESVSSQRCDPFSAKRDGITIGEGTGIFLLSKTPDLSGCSMGTFCGGGISMDAHHMSAPEPSGKGATLAMQKALRDAALTATDISYVNLHGTATRQNDAMEAAAMTQVFPHGVACSSTKSMTGHALGAASAIEAVICLLTLDANNADALLPPHIWSGTVDPSLPPLAFTGIGQTLESPAHYAMSNSFAFGGNNVSLIFGRAP